VQEAAASHGSRPPRDREGRDGQVELELEMGLEVDVEAGVCLGGVGVEVEQPGNSMVRNRVGDPNPRQG
jgi:hypothetical protein